MHRGSGLRNPVIAASGTFGYGMEYNEFYPLSRLGGISCKGTTLKERQGNPPSRIAETPSGMLNSVGLQNPGVDRFLSVYLPWLLKQDTVVIANMAGARWRIMPLWRSGWTPPTSIWWS